MHAAGKALADSRYCVIDPRMDSTISDTTRKSIGAMLVDYFRANGVDEPIPHRHDPVRAASYIMVCLRHELERRVPTLRNIRNNERDAMTAEGRTAAQALICEFWPESLRR